MHDYHKKAVKFVQASIAQWLEHWSCKPGVVSSILTGGLHFYNSRGRAYVIIKTAFLTICTHLITSNTYFKIQEKLYSYVTL